MHIVEIALVAAALALQPANKPTPPLAVLKAGLGPCSADFTVKDASAMPIYGAAIHVKVRYGLWNIKRADLEVGTDSDGKARVEGLPEKARLLHYDITQGGRTSTVAQDVSAQCHSDYAITLK